MEKLRSAAVTLYGGYTVDSLSSSQLQQKPFMPCRNFNQKDSESRPSCPHGTVRLILYHDLPAPGTARKILYHNSPAPGTVRQILYHEPPAPGTARKILYHAPHGTARQILNPDQTLFFSQQ